MVNKVDSKGVLNATMVSLNSYTLVHNQEHRVNILKRKPYTRRMHGACLAQEKKKVSLELHEC
jgi:hypothetical protein